MIIDDRLRIILTRLLTILASRAARRNETDEGGSMHVRRMAKDLCSRMKTFSTLLSTLLARVVSSSLPLFISFVSSSFISSSLFIYVHLARSLAFLLLPLPLSFSLIACNPTGFTKRTLCEVFLRFSLSSFLFSLSSLPFFCFVFFFPPLFSVYFFSFS